MTTAEVLSLLEKNKNEKGIEHWKKSGYKGMTSFGMGLGQIKKLVKDIPKSQELGYALWKTDNYESKQLACMILDGKKMSEEELTAMVEDADFWMICHAFIQNTLAKYPQRRALSEKWMKSDDEKKRRCGFGLLYYMAKDAKIEDEFYFPIIEHIEKNLQKEENFVKDQMNNALFALGQKSKILNEKCLKASKNIGTVMVDYGDNSCAALDVVKHLSGERIQKKFA